MPAHPSIVRCGAFALVGAAALTARAAPRGRVVRVERAPAVTPPGYCTMPTDAKRLSCFGRPSAGEHVAVIDVAKRVVRGDFVIESSAEDLILLGAQGVCVGSGAYAVKGRFARGAADWTSELIGLRGLQLGKQARVLAGAPPLSSRPGERVELAVDADGDGRADVVVTRYACDASGAPARGAEGSCIDIYVAEQGRLQRTSQDVVTPCT